MSEQDEPNPSFEARPVGNDPLDLVPLPGSERPPATGATPAATAAGPDSVVQATIVVRRRRVVDPTSGEAPGVPLTAAELAVRYGADPRDLAKVASTLEPLGVTILELDSGSRRVRIEASLATVQRVFGTELSAVTSVAPDGSTVQHRHRTGGLSIPAPLKGIVTAVLGLDDRPQARSQFRVAEAAAVSTSYTPLQLGKLYNFPFNTDGRGQTIAIIELGGGYKTSDLSTYFAGLRIALPLVRDVGVDGATNGGGTDPGGADGEVLLDIEVAGALSPASTFVVYFAPNTDAGFVDAVSTAAHAMPTPTAMSISWGQSEDAWTPQARTALDDALRDAELLGVTVTAAAGDNGSSDGVADGRNHADFPASSPHVLACGGTSLRASGRTILSETVWNDGPGRGATGGGVSDAFARPVWQAGVAVVGGGPITGRGVPDVAGNADPATGYDVLVDGTRQVFGGTSAVAPLWAALAARLAQALGTRLGALQPRLYSAAAAQGAGAFRDVTEGNNGFYTASPGWDACTGLGTPNGDAILATMQTLSRRYRVRS